MAVRNQIEAHGGSVCYGWQIWEWPNVLINAEFHAVWKDPSGSLVDITPKPPPIQRILFLPDPTREYDGRQVNNVRRPLRNDPAIKRFIKDCDREFEISNRGDRATQYDRIDVEEDEWKELEAIKKRKAEFLLRFKSKPAPIRSQRIGRNEPCPCGSGKKYKKCCGGYT